MPLPPAADRALIQNRLIVKFKTEQIGNSEAVLSALAKAANAQVVYVRSITPQIHVYAFSTAQPALAVDLARRAQQWPEVEFAEFDQRVPLIQ